MYIKALGLFNEVIKMQYRFKPVPGRNGLICKAIVYNKTINL
jgi:hypothetical protein